jgi:hypothetical protein
VKRHFLTLLFLCVICITKAQEFNPSDTAKWFDFWVGEWNGSWDEGDGKKGHGTNVITKELDGKVIRENFTITSGQNAGFKGTSISVHQPRQKSWKQAWADNNGGYYDFTGEIDGNKRIFKTAVFERNDKYFQQRMVFYAITDQTMTWDWEYSQDGGKSWELSWRINYTRVQ